MNVESTQHVMFDLQHRPEYIITADLKYQNSRVGIDSKGHNNTFLSTCGNNKACNTHNSRRHCFNYDSNSKILIRTGKYNDKKDVLVTDTAV